MSEQETKETIKESDIQNTKATINESDIQDTKERKNGQEITENKSETGQEVSEEIAQLISEGDKAFALREYAQSVDRYGRATELMTEIHGEASPKCADVLFRYGRSLLEYAVAQSSVLGQQGQEHVKRDGNDNDNEEIDEDEEQEQEEQEQEQEDDFQTAWNVLDLSRALYEKSGTTDKLRLANVYLALGDVSLETEMFQQAAEDYRSGLELKRSVLERDSRELAEAHWKLAIVLEFSGAEKSEALKHVHAAMDVLRYRIEICDDEDDKRDAGELLKEMEPKIEELSNTAPKLENEVSGTILERDQNQSTNEGKGKGKVLESGNGVNDITSLVKRKANDDSNGGSSKKAKEKSMSNE